MKGVPKFIAWYFCTLLHMSTLITTVQPQRAAATLQPPAPAQRSRTLTPLLVGWLSCRWSCGLEVAGVSW